MSKAEFLKMVREHMRTNKNSWLIGNYEVDGHNVGIKLFNKSIQNLVIDGLSCGGRWEIPTQKEVIQHIENYLDRA